MENKIPENIEVFNQIVLHILVKLYDSFPKPIDLDYTDIGFDAFSDEEKRSELFNATDVAMHSVDWLEQEGFITIKLKPKNQRRDYHGVRLTLKGLTLLGYTPASAVGEKNNKPIIDFAKKVLSKATEKTASDVVNSLFMLAIKSLPTMMG